MFDREKERQLSLVKAIEKIEVKHQGSEDQCTLMMNKYLSTPYHVAMRKYHCILVMVGGGSDLQDQCSPFNLLKMFFFFINLR